MLLLGAWYVSLLSVFFCVVCVFMILVILIQRPRGGGLSGAFGGSGGGSQAVFGAKTGDVLTWFTVVCFATFLVLAMGLTWSISYERRSAMPTIQAMPSPLDSPTDTSTPSDTTDPTINPQAPNSRSRKSRDRRVG